MTEKEKEIIRCIEGILATVSDLDASPVAICAAVNIVAARVAASTDVQLSTAVELFITEFEGTRQFMIENPGTPPVSETPPPPEGDFN